MAFGREPASARFILGDEAAPVSVDVYRAVLPMLALTGGRISDRVGHGCEAVPVTVVIPRFSRAQRHQRFDGIRRRMYAVRRAEDRG